MIRHAAVFRLGPVALLLACVLTAPGCGLIAEKDLIVIAEVDGEAITRGDLYEIIRKMPDNKRPSIRTRRDFLRVLNEHIDKRITIPIGEQLREEGKINIPRDLAREQYFQQIPDEKDREHQRNIYAMAVPAPGQETQLMEVYGLTPSSLEAMKAVIEQETDLTLQHLQAEAAVAYLAMQGIQSGDLKIPQEEIEQEYEFRKDDLKTLEWLRFLAIRFPAGVEGALERASEVRRRIDAGESFDALVEEYLRLNRSFVIDSEIENNPGLERFKTFWFTVSGAKPGDIVGPVYLPEAQQASVGDQTQSQVIGDSYLVLKVLERRPESVKSLEQALPDILPMLARSKMLEKLREQHGVRVFEEKLPQPTGADAMEDDPFADL